MEYKHELGQNFIYDKNLISSLVKLTDVGFDDVVIEIGAGVGSLTRELARNCKKVYSFEIDLDLSDKLKELEQEFDNVEIIFNDFMKVDFGKFLNEIKLDKIKVVANIPYYLTTPIIFKLCEYRDKIISMYFMVQNEVATRFASKSGSKEYGIPSITMQAISDVKILKIVGKQCFTPVPKVDSAFIEFKMNLNKFDISNYDKFCDFIKSCFAMRRKTIFNNIKKISLFDNDKILKILHNLNLDEKLRPEQICIEDYVKMFNSFYS